jgi:hypothetical protein
MAPPLYINRRSSKCSAMRGVPFATSANGRSAMPRTQDVSRCGKVIGCLCRLAVCLREAAHAVTPCASVLRASAC